MTCDWPIDRTCITTPLPAEDDDGYPAALATRNGAEDVAVSILWSLSGRQFGTCPTIVRPCPEGPSYRAMLERPGAGYNDDGYGGGGGVTSYVLSWEGDSWLNLPCGCFGGRCRQSGPRMAHLPGPVNSITAVTIGGVVQDPSTYVLEFDVLYRVGGRWPAQDLGRPAGEGGTWSVEYLRGFAPPSGTASMVGALTNEVISACAGGKCRLPRNITAVTRNGVSYQVYDPKAIYEMGKTGLPEVDLWLSAINPGAHHASTDGPMSEIVCVDDALNVVALFSAALGQAFDPTSACPPDAGGTTTVRFFAGEAPPLASFDQFKAEQGGDCTSPFLWVRVMKRYRVADTAPKRGFPPPSYSHTEGCQLRRAMMIEIGVGRCAVVDMEPTWAEYETEAQTSLDDSWRIEKALCQVVNLLTASTVADYTVATDAIIPYGPDGGVIAWTAVSYVLF